MSDIKLIERLKGYTVAQICNVVIEIAKDYCAKHYASNDTQGTSSVIGVAIDARSNYPGLANLTLENLLPSNLLTLNDSFERKLVFGDIRWLVGQTLLGRQLKESTKPIPYATVDEFIRKMQETYLGLVV